MATSYPGALDSWTNPTSTTTMDQTGFEHDLVHSNVFDALEAVEGELGVDPAGPDATVAARLDYLTRFAGAGPFIWRSGDYLSNQYTTSAASTTQSIFTNIVAFIPLWIPRTRTADRVGVHVITTGASSNLRIGLYDATSELIPGSLITTFGVVSAATTGLKEITISESITGGRLYYVALHTDVTCGLRALTEGDSRGIIAQSGSIGGARSFGDDETYASGLPSTATLNYTSAGATAVVFLRAA